MDRRGISAFAEEVAKIASEFAVAGADEHFPPSSAGGRRCDSFRLRRVTSFTPEIEQR
jgi:hypothetical protein